MPISFDSILFPTDFSDLSLCALRQAQAIADRFESQLHCLHVVDEAYQYWGAMGPESIPVGPPPDNLLESAEARMKQFCEEHLGGIKPPPITNVRLGRPFLEIINYSREHDVSLIVMGTHGRGAIAHILLGSTTEKVVRKAPCAVMTVRNADQEFVMP